jgi:tRNASer (uridine44-2'-O)-methyltransferase
VDEFTSDFSDSVPRLKGKRIIRVIHRKLLPRRPGRDAALEQYCSLYGSDDTSYSSPDTLILTPIIDKNTPLPYYHPTVFHLAFQYIASSPTSMLRIEAVPYPGTPTDPDSRLYRTCLALLDTLDRYGWGAMTNYKKRVMHDCLVPREAYQDLYLVMRERHKGLVDTWQEVTDPLKHVFEVRFYLFF